MSYMCPGLGSGSCNSASGVCEYGITTMPTSCARNDDCPCHPEYGCVGTNYDDVTADKAACCVAQATCGDADGEGSGTAAVSDTECGDGFVFDASSGSSLCQGTVCDVAHVLADKAACCVAQATCGDADGEGSGTAAVSDTDCGRSWLYDPSRASQRCAGATCAPGAVDSDKASCCIEALCAQTSRASLQVQGYDAVIDMARTVSALGTVSCYTGYVQTQLAVTPSASCDVNGGEFILSGCSTYASCGDADGEGSGTAAVSDADCGDGFVARASSGSSLCQGAVCDVANVLADKAACCVVLAT